MSVFNPPLPIKYKGNLYLDTSVLRILILASTHPLAKEIIKELGTTSAPTQTSDYVVYELKRACLVPIWEFYQTVDHFQDISKAILSFSQEFQGRKAKFILEIVSALANDAIKISASPQLFQNQLLGLVQEIEYAIEHFCKKRVSNKTGCSLHKGEFKVNENLADKFKCQTNCKVDEFWDSQKKKINDLIKYGSQHLTSEEKKTYSKVLPEYKNLIADSNHGKSEINCKILADSLILLHSPITKTLVLSQDNSFVNLSKATNHKVHQLISVSAYLGGSASTIAKNHFQKKNDNLNNQSKP